MNWPNPTSSCKIPQLGLKQKMIFFLQFKTWMGQTQPLHAKFLNWVLNKKWFFLQFKTWMGQTQPLNAKFLNWVFNKKWFFCNWRHEWAKPNLFMQNSSIGSSTKIGFLQLKTWMGQTQPLHAKFLNWVFNKKMLFLQLKTWMGKTCS